MFRIIIKIDRQNIILDIFEEKTIKTNKNSND